MDLYKAIEELERERTRIVQTILYLEGLVAAGAKPAVRKKSAPVQKKSRRGRPKKAAPKAPELEVSEQMVQYWRDHPAVPDGGSSGGGSSK